MKRNQEEFLKMLSAYQGIIHKVNQIYFKSKADKEENFQETAYQLWRSFHSLQNREKPASWIYTVAINISISKIRKDSLLDFRDSVPDVDMIDPYSPIKNSSTCTSPFNGCRQRIDIDCCIFHLNCQTVICLISNSSDNSKEDIPFFFVLILKTMWNAINKENLSLSNIVPAVGLSSYLHLLHRLEQGFIPLQKLRLPHCLQTKPSCHLISERYL